MAAALAHLAGLALARGDVPDAASGYAESLRLWAVLQDRRGIAQTLEGCADLLCTAGRPAPARDLRAQADALLAALGVRRSPAERASFEELSARIHSAVGSTQPAPTDPVARGIDLEQGVGHALALLAALPAPPPHPHARSASDAHPLTHREREIAALIARGLTNRAIAERLVIAERTAETHVSNILGKLGLDTRAQIATWAVARRLRQP
jgi:non-specific serine/threonine protein kinase